MQIEEKHQKCRNKPAENSVGPRDSHAPLVLLRVSMRVEQLLLLWRLGRVDVLHRHQKRVPRSQLHPCVSGLQGIGFEVQGFGFGS